MRSGRFWKHQLALSQAVHKTSSCPFHVGQISHQHFRHVRSNLLIHSLKASQLRDDVLDDVCPNMVPAWIYAVQGSECLYPDTQNHPKGRTKKTAQFVKWYRCTTWKSLGFQWFPHKRAQHKDNSGSTRNELCGACGFAFSSSFLSFSEVASHLATCKDLIFLPTSNAMSKELQPSCSKGHIMAHWHVIACPYVKHS